MIHIELPLSKSQINRTLIAIAGQGNLSRWLSEHAEINSSGCRDTRLLVEALVNFQNGTSKIDFQDAGTPCRLFTAFAAAKFKSAICIGGNASLNNRSISPLVEALTLMGANIRYTTKEGYPPIVIENGIHHWQDVRISTAVSSQFASALLLIAPIFNGIKKLTLTEISHSQSYVDLTLHLLRTLGIDIEDQYLKDTREITLSGTYNEIPHPTPELLELEADWSSAAFFYPLLLGMKNTDSMVLVGLRLHSTQGDAQLATLGNLLGIQTTAHPNGVFIQRFDSSSHEKQEILSVDLKDNPDLVPALVVGCCILGKSITLKGIENLRYKECDRIAALQDNLAPLGCSLEQWNNDDSADLWHLNASNRSFPDSMCIDTKEDHRIAMAFASLKNWIPQLTFSDSNCVEKSFPNYWDQWKKCTFE